VEAGGGGMKNLAELTADFCRSCEREIRNKTIEEYPIEQIIRTFESLGKMPMFWGYYEYKGKEYTIEIIVKEKQK
jgi:hypothetical protein